jgi:drug/metabolite transporter (DMT)-like permease
VLPRVLLLFAVVIWGWTFVATKILVAEIGPVEVFALRLALGLPFLGVVLLVKRVPIRFARADAGRCSWAAESWRCTSWCRSRAW